MLSQDAFVCGRGCRGQGSHSRFKIQLRGLTSIIDTFIFTTALWVSRPPFYGQVNWGTLKCFMPKVSQPDSGQPGIETQAGLMVSLCSLTEASLSAWGRRGWTRWPGKDLLMLPLAVWIMKTLLRKKSIKCGPNVKSLLLYVIFPWILRVTSVDVWNTNAHFCLILFKKNQVPNKAIKQFLWSCHNRRNWAILLPFYFWQSAFSLGRKIGFTREDLWVEKV